ATKLNVLVGQLRTGGHISTEQLYKAVAKERALDVAVMTDQLALSAQEHGTAPPRDDEGKLHWAPLRDSLMRPEAHDLIDRLESMQARLGGSFGETPSGTKKATQGELPEGY